MLAFTHLQLDGGVVGIALALSAFATLASGLVPSLRALRSDVKLREATLRIVRASRLGKVFVVIQVALAVVLLVGAGLLLRTVWNMTQVDPGFRPAQLLTAQTILGRKYSDPALRTQFYSEVLARVKSLPGVVDAAYGTTVPTAWKGGFTSYSVDGQPFSPGRSIAMHRQVTPSYFSVMGIRLLQGRLIDENDTANTPPVAVINQTMAKRVWGGLDPVGKQFRRGSPESQAPLITVVGVVEDVLEMGLTEDAPAITYFSQRQQANATFSLPEHLLVRTQGEPSLLGEAVRRTILSVNPNQPIAKLMPATAVLDREWKERRIHASLIGAFAGAALLLAAIGIHGVLAYMVVRRRPELGLRLSLGAQPADLMRMVLSEGMRLVLIGAVIGTAASAILARSMQSLLFQVRPADPSMVAAGAGVLLIVALVACWVPARRTLRISPAESLRLS
jgi:putative ABC transport system permease protein